jgi:hypothetical protein
MIKRFTWERAPFERCPACQRDTFGILSVGGDCVTLRCTECRYSHSEVLPEVNKRAIYLDQSIFSLLFQVQCGGRLPSGHEEFARALYRGVRRGVLLQQVVLPHSDVHQDETIVFHSANELRAAYELIGGDASLKNTREVERMQMWEYVQAYIEDPMAFFEASNHHLLEEQRMLSSAFRRAGVAEADVGREVLRFWEWDRNLEQPHHRISAYMFAAIGRRVVNGQRRVNRGMMNDVRAIGTYAPYVDAMFVDRECAALLAEYPLTQDLNYKARIFSLTNGQAFLDCLAEIEAATPPEVREQAARIYGIETGA